MKHATAQAFRTALETKIKELAVSEQTSIVRLRKMAAFDRLLARLLIVSPGRWVVKGGLVLDLRRPNQVRATKDLDLARKDTENVVTDELMEACDLDLGDFFVYTVRRVKKIDDDQEDLAVRFHVRSELAGRPFEEVIVDVGLVDPLPVIPNLLAGPNILAFAGLPTIEIPALPLDQHLGKKLHAYTRIYGANQRSTRPKDLIDIVLIQSLATFSAEDLRHAFERTFSTRATHTLPDRLPQPPTAWETPYRTLAESIGLDSDVKRGYETAARLLDPIRASTMEGDASWDPVLVRWSTAARSG